MQEIKIDSAELASSIQEAINRQLALQNQPASEEKLQKIWHPWNALEDDSIPEWRGGILSGDFQPHHAPAYEKVKSQFVFLPVNKDEYYSTFKKAMQWSNLRKQIRITKEKFSDLAQRQSDFSDADHQALGRITLFRAIKETDLTHPELGTKLSPSIAEIDYFQDRLNAYAEARDEALLMLDTLLYERPGIRTEKKLTFEQTAFGVPDPPKDVARHIYFARLEAFNIASPRLKEFMVDEFFDLSRSERLQFYEAACSARHGNRQYGALEVWCLDNIPVFQKFDWRPPDIRKVALDLGLHCQLTDVAFAKWTSERKIPLKLTRGSVNPNFDHKELIRQSTPLLTPAPRFHTEIAPK